jgi:hypothetical protein
MSTEQIDPNVAGGPPEATEQPTTATRERELVLHPHIWVGPRADYEAERRYGAWIDAAQPEPDVSVAINNVLDQTPDGLSVEWGIYDVRDFGRWLPAPEDALTDVLRVARGIVEHGAPYGALAAVVGADSLAAQPERFAQSFLGSWPSMEAFVTQVAVESGWHEYLKRLPSSMRPYIGIDVASLAAAAAQELTVVNHDAGVWVYDPRVW